MAKIIIDNLSKIFGHHPGRAFRMLDQGVNKDDILEKSGQAIGMARVSFEVYQGETLVVMGLSGSGKSTLLRCVNRLIRPTRGTVVVDGIDVTALHRKELLKLRREKFGMVFQNFGLFPHRTVLANTEYGLEIQKIDKAEREEKSRTALELVGLKGWEDAMTGQLSGGMQQRVGLARALAVDPDILLMDEAFSALDPLIRRDMQDQLISLQDRMKKTILFITHDLDEALKLGDRIVLMKDGLVVQIGTPEEVLTDPATPYVEKFVEGVNKSAVLTARSVMVRPHEVAFPKDGPRTALHKMRKMGINSIFVVKPNFTFRGLLKAKDASRAVEEGNKQVESILNTEIQTVNTETPVSDLIPLLASEMASVAVLDEEEKLVGYVNQGSLLGGLAEGGRS